MTGLTSPTHIVLLLLLALLLFGAKRLPEIGRSLGSGMREFKDSVSGKDDHTEATVVHAEPTVVHAPTALPVGTQDTASQGADSAAPRENETVR
jgi:sec-independent protein translocase protein TatA